MIARVSDLAAAAVATSSNPRQPPQIVARLTHTIPMDWMLPGIPPTRKRVEVALVEVVQFEGDTLTHRAKAR